MIIYGTVIWADKTDGSTTVKKLLQLQILAFASIREVLLGLISFYLHICTDAGI